MSSTTPPDDISTNEPKIPGASDDLLAELRAKTAELAKEVKGSDTAQKHILEINEPNSEDILKDLAVEKDYSHKQDPEKTTSSLNNPAVKLLQNKLAKLYRKEPDAAEEALEAYQIGQRRSKHQQFMYDLTTSGKSLADIQTAWHKYYVALPNEQKHQVWKEFYETQRISSNYAKAQQKHVTQNIAPQKHPKTNERIFISPSSNSPRSVKDIKNQLLDTVSAGGRLKPMHHIKSLLFGVGLSALVGLIVVFTFFNQVFIAPFISPSRNVSATPIIGPQAGEVSKDPKIIIPKINLEVPVVFDLGSVEERDIQKALEDGVVHYSSTPNPGEQGNSVIVGHSSNNILNAGKYKFAFVLLKRLEPEDTFFVQKDGVRYTYKVYKKEIVSPNNTGVLSTQERPNTMTLITCDPPGTSINRLIVTAEQIDPDPSSNKPSSALDIQTPQNSTLPSNAPSLWSRIWPF